LGMKETRESNTRRVTTADKQRTTAIEGIVQQGQGSDISE